LAKASWRLLPLFGLGYGIAYMDRANIGYAQFQMSVDLSFSATVYGLGAGLFFLSYALMEVPSNLLLVRFGARRWIARIMLTWGVLAMGMMFVKTPLQYYAMRFLLGAAEAGFFPGVVFYLMHWFPAYERGRAVSRFYVALPLSMVVMGAISGALLNLQGLLGLAGWQWLFAVEGLPAVLLGLTIFFLLPDSPERAKWLTEAERAAIARGLAADLARSSVPADQSMLGALRDPWVWLLGLANVCIMGGNYAFALSMPTIVRGATHLDTTHTGYLIAGVALFSSIGMIAAGWFSDLRRERHLHLVTYLLLAACASAVMGLTHSSPIFVLAFASLQIAIVGQQVVFWLIPSDFLRGRSAAAGLAAVVSIGMIGAFIAPSAWGVARDMTGSYQVGLVALAAPYTLAALIVMILRKRISKECPLQPEQEATAHA